MSEEIAFEDFDPNDPAHMGATWMVYTGSWRGVHLAPKRATALNRVSAARKAKLYEGVPGKGWVLRAVKGGEHVDVCDECGGPVVDSHDQNNGRYSWKSSPYVWRRKNGRIVSPPEMAYVCAPCVPSVEHG